MAKKLVVEIVGDASSLQRAFGNATKGSSRLGGSFKSLAKVTALGVGAAFAGLAVVVKQGFDELSEGQKVASDTAAILKATGGVANVTAKDVSELAEAQSQLTGVDDELIQASENLLLTFKNVRNEVGKGNDIFNRATVAGLDLAQVGFGTPETAAKMLGKALNDPIKGMSALGRAGVTFSDDQKKAIKAMVESNDLLGAQRLILKEVESQVGGSAKAFGETLPGQINKLRNSFMEMAAGIAEVLLPHLLKLLDWVNAHMPEIQRTIETAVTVVVAVINFLVPIIQTLIGWFQTLAEFSQKHWATVQQAGERVVAWYRGSLAPVIQNVLAVVMALWNRFGSTIMTVVQNTFGTVFTIVKTILGNLSSIFNAVLAILRGDWGTAWKEIKEIPGRTLGAMIQIIRNSLSTLAAVAMALGKAIIDGILAGIKATWSAVAGWLSGLPGRIRGAIGNLGRILYDVGLSVLQGFWDGMKDKWNDVTGWLSGLGPSIPRLKGPPGKDAVLLKPVGELIMKGLQDGLLNGWDKVETMLETLSPKMTEKMGALVEKAIAAIKTKQEAFSSAFSGLASNALAAFDKIVSEWKPPAAKLLEAFDAKQAKAELKKRVDELKGALLVARTELEQVLAAGPEAVQRKEGETDEAFNQRQLEAQRQFLEKKAAAEAAAASAFLALQEEQRNQQLAKERAALEKRAAEQQKKHDQQKERERVLFETSLQKLQNAYARQEITTQEFHTRLIALFKKFEVPFGKATERLGFALAKGLRDSFEEVHKAARALAQEVLAAFEGITIRIKTELQHTDSPGRQHGGPVSRGRSYIVGEAGPELFVPNTSGRIVPNGGTASLAGGVVVNIYGDVTGDEVVERVRQGLLRINQFNPGNPVAR